MTTAEAMDRAIALIEGAVASGSFEDFADAILPQIADLAGIRGSFLYVPDPRLHAPYFAASGLEADRAAALEDSSSEWFDRMSDAYAADGGGPALVEDGLSIEPLPVDGRVIGMIGLDSATIGWATDAAEWPRLREILGRVTDHLADEVSTERRLLHLNTYLTVSSMLSKSVDLAELLEIALYSGMEAASAEAASILLLDEEKENFQFYRVEGAAKPLLGGSTFPASEGVAGRVMQSLEAEIVNDVEVDAGFYGQIDQKTGFQTRNMIAVPLVAGEERVGVLEVLNRVDGGPFTADERLILVSVADEIAFAVRNATVFEYVVNTYCRRRQGENSCKGCERPLGSWTPCMRYREFLP